MARDLHAGGMRAIEIAQRLGVRKVQTVKNWVKA